MLSETLVVVLALSAPPLAADLEAFCQKEWPTVSAAKERLAAREKEALPELIKLVAREQRVPLVDTADLIYPGAKTFYGHGYIIPYELDSLSARAGWLLEEITFEDFGFSSRDLRSAAEKARAWWASNSGTWTKYGAVRGALASSSARRQMAALGWLQSNTARCSALSHQSCTAELRPLVRHLAARGSAAAQERARRLLRDREWQP